MRHVFSGNSLARIPHDEAGIRARFSKAQIYIPPLLGVFDGIRYQVEQNLLKAVPIPVDNDLIDLRQLDIHPVSCQDPHFLKDFQ